MQQGTQLYFPPLTPLMKKLIGVCVICFLLQYLSPILFDFHFTQFFALIPKYTIDHLWLWQLFTYMFLHGGLVHLLLNMFILWMFGGDLEGCWGPKRFIKFYLLAGIFSGLVSAICYYNVNNPIIGASGAIFALLVAFGFMFPNRVLLFFFVFPMKAKYFVMIIALIAFWVPLFEGGGNTAHFAHIGGIVFGFLYMKFGQWRNVVSRYKEIKRKSEKDRLKSRFKVITDDMDKNDVEEFWKHHKDDPNSWN